MLLVAVGFVGGFYISGKFVTVLLDIDIQYNFKQ
jgi:hypothetical protein